ncbi:alpha/beta fold hydrolase [Anabaena azotica]|uniref:alpha/beta fold hydrolase n=1 Tax=Anabaena azotica TaxID=197653 RepID=UPI0039A5DF24
MIQYIKTSRLNIAYHSYGEIDSPTIILLHGWPDDALTWNAIIPALLNANYRCITPYLRGFGLTHFLDSQTLRSGQLAALSQDIIEFIEALKIGSVHLVGHDWGARIGYNIAALRPDLLHTLTTLSVGYGTNNPDQELSFSQVQQYWYQWFFATERGRKTLAADRSDFTRQLWKFWCPSWRFSDAEFQTTAKSFANPDWVDITIDSYRNRWGISPNDSHYDTIHQKLMTAPKINVPTTVLHGGADGATLPETSANKEQFFLKDYQRFVIPEVGHFIQREAPQIVIEAVLDRVQSKKYNLIIKYVDNNKSMSKDSTIIQFYSGKSAYVRGRMLQDIWQQNYEWLEKTHDYIQWLFPLTERSRFNPNAPILTDDDIQSFHNREDLKRNLVTSLKLMLGFYGLSCQESKDGAIKIKIDQSFAERKKVWVHWGNHNHLRITRILRSLHLLGLEIYAQAFFRCLEEIYNLEKGEITKLTFSHWQDALSG